VALWTTAIGTSVCLRITSLRNASLYGNLCSRNLVLFDSFRRIYLNIYRWVYVHCHSSISAFSHRQCTYILASMTALPCVKTLLAVIFWKWFQYCYDIVLSVFVEFRIRFLEGNSFYFQGRGKSHTAGLVGYIVCSSIGKPNCFWPKLLPWRTFTGNMSAGIIQNELVWLRIWSLELDVMC